MILGLEDAMKLLKNLAVGNRGPLGSCVPSRLRQHLGRLLVRDSGSGC